MCKNTEHATKRSVVLRTYRNGPILLISLTTSFIKNKTRLLSVDPPGAWRFKGIEVGDFSTVIGDPHRSSAIAFGAKNPPGSASATVRTKVHCRAGRREIASEAFTLIFPKPHSKLIRLDSRHRSLLWSWRSLFGDDHLSFHLLHCMLTKSPDFGRVVFPFCLPFSFYWEYPKSDLSPSPPLTSI